MATGSKLATGWLELTVSTAGAQQAITNEVVPAAEVAGATAGKKMGGGLLSGIKGIAGPLLAIAGVGAVFKTGFDEAKDAATNTAQLTAGLKSTSGAAGVTVGQMNDLAAQIQSYSGQTDDSIAKTESLLLTFTNIKNVGPDKIFNQATKASADMAARLGGDASSNAILLGKALNDPVKGITALTRVGVSFTQQQRDQIGAMVASGDTLGAQKTILAEVNKEFGGSAKAAGDTFPGQLNKLKRSFEDVSQTIVEAFTPIVTSLVPVITGAFKAIGPVLGGIASFIKPLAPVLVIVVGAILAVVAAMKVWAVVQGILNVVMDANPIVLIVLAVLALVAAIIWVATQTTFFQDAWKAVSTFFVALWQNVASFFTTIWTNIVNFFVGIWNGIVAFIVLYITLVNTIWTTVWTAIVTFFVGLWNGIVAFFVGIWTGIVAFVTTYINTVVAIIQAVGATIAAIWNGIWNGISSFFSGIWNGIVNGVKSGIDGIVGFFQGIPGTISRLFSGAINWLVDAGKNIIQGLLNGAGQLLKNIGSFFLSIIPGWIVAPFKAALGIHSPSTVFEQFGVYTMQGYVNGVQKQQAATNAAVRSAVSVPTTGGGSPKVGAAPIGGAVHLTVPIYTQENDGRVIGRRAAREIVRALAG